MQLVIFSMIWYKSSDEKIDVIFSKNMTDLFIAFEGCRKYSMSVCQEL